MKFPGFIGPSYKLKSVNADCQRCVNLYPEINETKTGKEGEVAALFGTPGLNLLTTIGTGPHRGAFTTSNGAYYVVSGVKLYKVASDFSTTEIGTILSTSGQVSMADNGIQLVVVDGVNGYYVTLSDDTFHTITDPLYTDRTPPKRVAFLDGFFLFTEPETDDWFISEKDAITFDADFSDADGYPDALVSHIVNDRQIWLFGETTTEVWFNAGGATFPFSRVSGAYVQQGCAAPFSVATIGSAVFWLSKDDKGGGIVVMAEQYQPRRVSTHAVEVAIQSYGLSISDATAYTYQENGHAFYVLNFTTANTTWSYDLSTGLWHERAFTRNGTLERHRGETHAFAFGKHLVGDYETGKLYEMSEAFYSDDGEAITRKRVTPHVSGSQRRVWYSSLQVDIEAGTGLDGVGQGVDPKIMMKYSDDGGHSWSNEKWAEIGKIGQRKHRAIWRRLGQSRDRVFDITVTDPVKVVFLSAQLDLMIGGA